MCPVNKRPFNVYVLQMLRMAYEKQVHLKY